ncbi:MAG: hypothetical protein VX512_11300 [Pseudomonadota bacterium]|nr:hypothetical protein [Pseudomonadota bacterium]
MIEQGGYASIFFLMFAETLFPPIPSEVVKPVAGVSASNGKLSLDLASPCQAALRYASGRPEGRP